MLTARLMQQLIEAYIKLAQHPIPKEHRTGQMPQDLRKRKLNNLHHVAVVTCKVPVDKQVPPLEPCLLLWFGQHGHVDLSPTIANRMCTMQ